MDTKWYQHLSRREAEIFVLAEGHRAVLRPSSLTHKYPNTFALTYVTRRGVQHTLLQQEHESWRIMELDRYECVLPTDWIFPTLDKAIETLTA